jgi:predicted ATPase
MIERLHLVNFKNHADSTFEFGKLTVLTGPNAVGKSNVLRAIQYADDAMRLVKDNWKPNDEEKRAIRYGAFDTKIDLSRSEGLNISVSMSTVEIVVAVDSEYFIPMSDRNIRCASYISPSVALARSPDYSDDIPPKLQPDGSGIASVVSYLRGYDEEAFAEIQNAVRQVIPQVERIRTYPAKITERRDQKVETEEFKFTMPQEVTIPGHELRFDVVGAKDLRADAVSDGTLIATLLLVAIYYQNGGVILIDDIEEGLHPAAQRDLVNHLKTLVAQRDDLQIICTTHSPYIVNELEADQVYVLNTDDEGVAHAKKLSEHPDADEMLKVLSTGEFWSAEDEDWVLPEKVNA